MQDLLLAEAVDAPGDLQHVLGLRAVAAGVHGQRAADRARNAGVELQAGDAGLGRRAGDGGVERARRRRSPPRPRPATWMPANARPASRTTTPSTPPSRTMTLEPTPSTVSGTSSGRAAQELAEIVLVRRQEQHVRRPADPEPGEGRQRLVEQQLAARRRAGRRASSCGRHLPAASSWPGRAWAQAVMSPAPRQTTRSPSLRLGGDQGRQLGGALQRQHMAVAVALQALDQGVAVDALDRRLAGRVDVGHDHRVGVVEAAAELLEQVRAAGCSGAAAPRRSPARW